MSETIQYREFEAADFDMLLAMGKKLWPDFEASELGELLMETSKATSNKQIWLARTPDKYLGFAIFSIRTDYVEGAVKSPTGYLEGIFVEEESRLKGVAKSLFLLGEQWCKSKGCTQIGSDTWITATDSRQFHQQIGFWEEEEVVHFLKNI
ncbi:MAG: GNAT family N-acetyltransferase [Bacteroidota bacterium]